MKNLKILAILVIVLLTGCQVKSDYEKALELINGLETEVVQCTTQDEYDKVHERIIQINENPLMQERNYSNEEKISIISSTAQLTLKALAVKAILYVMPTDVKPTKKDMDKLVDDCIDKSLNTITNPYPDVRELVRKYYNKEDVE